MKEAFPTGVSTEAMTGIKQRSSWVQEVPYSDSTTGCCGSAACTLQWTAGDERVKWDGSQCKQQTLGRNH